MKEFPFTIQRIQTDRGGEFFGSAFQLAMMEKKIKFCPIRPYSPHLNGKVERLQRTDRVEFYSRFENSDPLFEEKMEEWQNFYNKIRRHSSLGGKSPISRFGEQQGNIPSQKQVVKNYQKSVEDYRS